MVRDKVRVRVYVLRFTLYVLRFMPTASWQTKLQNATSKMFMRSAFSITARPTPFTEQEEENRERTG